MSLYVNTKIRTIAVKGKMWQVRFIQTKFSGESGNGAISVSQEERQQDREKWHLS